MKRTAFTLIELLVVIGIVALVSAALLPVFSQVREKGRQTVCLSNEKQLGAAFLMYAHDNDNYLPRDSNGWAGAIFPDVKSVDVFHCPSDATSSQPPYYPVSYGVNADLWHVVALGADRHLLAPHSMAEVSAKTVLLFEVVHATAELTLPYEGWGDNKPIAQSVSATGNGGPLSVVGFFMGSRTEFDVDEDVRYATGLVASDRCDWSAFYEGPGRHQGGANFLYSDGHVEWLSPLAVSTGGDAVAPGDGAHCGSGFGAAAGSENSQFAATFSTK